MEFEVAMVGSATNSPLPQPADIKRLASRSAASVLPEPVTSSRINSCGVLPNRHLSTNFCNGVGVAICGNNPENPDSSVNGIPALIPASRIAMTAWERACSLQYSSRFIGSLHNGNHRLFEPIQSHRTTKPAISQEALFISSSSSTGDGRAISLPPPQINVLTSSVNCRAAELFSSEKKLVARNGMLLSP